MTVPGFFGRYRAECLLGGILILAAFLNLWNIWNQGDMNYYYAAAVKSMLENPVAGFFNSFDPAGFITVDKPPVGLWVQAAFAPGMGNATAADGMTGGNTSALYDCLGAA